MNTVCYILFCISIFLSVYTYVLYPLVLMLLKKVKPIKTIYRDDYLPKVSVLVAAYNEEKFIAQKVQNLLELNYPADKIEFLIGSDGSGDNTAAILNEFSSHPSVKVSHFKRSGKVGILNKLFKQASGEIFVFTDANAMFHPNAVKNLVKCFSGKIGCVSGQLRLRQSINGESGEQGESSYWKYENKIKSYESAIGKLSGANGAIYAVKRMLCEAIPNGIINDDFYISNRVIAKGYNVIMAQDAIAYEQPNGSLNSQFQRHIRDGAGHYQIITKFLNMLLPTKGLAWFTYTSHRFIRWMVPFFIIIAFVSNFILAFYSIPMAVVFALQVLCYFSLTIYYFVQKKGKKLPVFNIVFYFMCINFALFIGFFKYLFKLQKQTWETQR